MGSNNLHKGLLFLACCCWFYISSNELDLKLNSSRVFERIYPYYFMIYLVCSQVHFRALSKFTGSQMIFEKVDMRQIFTIMLHVSPELLLRQLAWVKLRTACAWLCLVELQKRNKTKQWRSNFTITETSERFNKKHPFLGGIIQCSKFLSSSSYLHLTKLFSSIEYIFV